jgi:hypothetical protein
MAAPKDRTVRKKAIDEIATMLVSGESYLINPNELKKKYDVSHPTILNWIERAYKQVKPEAIEKTTIQFQNMFNRMFQQAASLLEGSESSEEYRKNAEMVMKIMKEKTDFLERFHLKAKAQENIKLEVERQLVIDATIDDVIDIDDGESNDKTE